jgi:hypothetical protein
LRGGIGWSDIVHPHQHSCQIDYAAWFGSEEGGTFALTGRLSTLTLVQHSSTARLTSLRRSFSGTHLSNNDPGGEQDDMVEEPRGARIAPLESSSFRGTNVERLRNGDSGHSHYNHAHMQKQQYQSRSDDQTHANGGPPPARGDEVDRLGRITEHNDGLKLVRVRGNRRHRRRSPVGYPTV